MKKLMGILALMMALAVACDRDEDDETGRPPNEVWMDHNSFIPVTLIVTPGTSVRWVNNSAVIHNVVHETGLFNQVLNPGQAYSYTFAEAGTYNYECTIHPGMTGTIVVE
jgi:plastocyanin